MSADPQPTRRADLVRVAEAYLAERLTLPEFRRKLSLVWSRLSRRALQQAEAGAWAEIVSTAKELHQDVLNEHASPRPFDEQLLRELLTAILRPDEQRASSTRLRRAREIQRDIGAVLLAEWDPIGVNDVPEAADEYNSYVGGVYRLLASGATVEDLAHHLRDLEVDRMGLARADTKGLLHVAKKLLEINIELPDGSG